ncbi:hypothetical protein KQI63_09300 [bacterium]|nr:hypothetical protein [bacterium]
MKHSRAIPLLILLMTTFWTGCVTHTLFVDLSSCGVIRYILEGDSLDVYDGRIPHPRGDAWTLADRSSGMSADSSMTILLDYRAPLLERVVHPLAPRSKEGWIEVDQQKGIFVHRKTLRVSFPSWDVRERFGDPEDFIPEEVRQLEAIGADTLLSESRQTELKRLKAKGMQKGAAQRYLKQEQALVHAWYDDRGLALPDSVMGDALGRFSAILQAYLITLRDDDPLDVSLEWYSDLKETMVIAAVEATGGEREWFSAASDSLELAYKSWVDLEDDAIEVRVLMPNWRVSTNADTISGDTLIWELDRELFADSTVYLSAIGYDPVPVTWVIALLLVGFGLGRLLLRIRRKRSLPSND